MQAMLMSAQLVGLPGNVWLNSQSPHGTDRALSCLQHVVVNWINDSAALALQVEGMLSAVAIRATISCAQL